MLTLLIKSRRSVNLSAVSSYHICFSGKYIIYKDTTCRYHSLKHGQYISEVLN